MAEHRLAAGLIPSTRACPRRAGWSASGWRPRRCWPAPRRESRGWPRVRGRRAPRSCWWRGAPARARSSSRPMPQPSSVTLMSCVPPASSLDRDVARAGVEAVFEQFLERRGGPFDDFAGGDLVDQQIGQDMYCRHTRLYRRLPGRSAGIAARVPAVRRRMASGGWNGYAPAANLPMLRLCKSPGFKVEPGAEGLPVGSGPTRGRVDLTQKRDA